MFIEKFNIKFFFIFFSLIFFFLIIFAGFKNYSSIPHWDMWESYLDFFYKISENNFKSLWSQHNEHRIVLSKLFFIIDFVIFDGKIWFLLVLNFILIALSCLIFFLFFKELNLKNMNWFPYFIVIWLYSYIQKENIIWAYQSHYFLAFMLPLLSLLYLQRSISYQNILENNFLLSLFFSSLSVLTLANGIFALFLNFFYLLILKSSIKKLFTQLNFAIFFVIIYFYDYVSPVHLGLGTVTGSIKNSPLEMINYTLMYLGNPFYYLFGKGNFGQIISILFGVFLILSTIYFFFKNIKTSKKTNLALVFFIIFIILTAFVTSGGRIVYGVTQSLSSRYTTPVLMCWLSLFLLFCQNFNFLNHSYKKKISYFFVFLVILMLPRQLKVFDNNEKDLFEKKIAALALELRINDINQFKHVYHSPPKLLNLTENAFNKSLSFFGNPPYVNLKKKIGTNIDLLTKENTNCSIQVNKISSINLEHKFLKLEGIVETNLVDEKNPTQFDLISFVNKEFIGSVIVSKESTNLSKDLKKINFFKGYFYDNKNELIYFKSSNHSCFYNLNVYGK